MSGGALEAHGITHAYGRNTVLRDVDLRVTPGSIEGLVGENGSGKSTMIKILTGAQRPVAGSLSLDGEPITLASPADARELGIAVVHQDYNLVDDLTVAENLVRLQGWVPRRRWTRLVDRRQVSGRVGELLGGLGIEVSADALVRTLSPAERKFVELAQAMVSEPRVLILDEPTASLEPPAADRVLELTESLRERGVGVLFVSHRLDEILRISDRITALRDGRLAGHLDGDRATEEGIARLILGEEPSRAAAPEPRDRPPVTGGATVEVSGLRLRAGGAEVSFEIRSGEILGLSGLLGSGAETALAMLGGLIPLDGELRRSGRALSIRNPRDARSAGIGFIPEDRKALGIVPEQSVALNISLASLAGVSHAGVLRRREIDRRATEYRERLDIRAHSLRVPAGSLSGGNVQKVLIAKWLVTEVDVLVVEEPTHGVDIGAKEHIHRLLQEFADSGGAVVVASTDVREVVSLCDRVAIFHDGALSETIVVAELERSVGQRHLAAQEFLERMVAGAGRGRRQPA